MHASNPTTLSLILLLGLAHGAHAEPSGGSTWSPQDGSSSRDGSQVVALPDGVSREDWSSIQQTIESERHSVARVDGQLQARNPGQRWSARFDRSGFEVHPDHGAWTWGLELTAYGWGEGTETVGLPGAPRACGHRVVRDWDERLEEWYVNDRRGLEHGYTVHDRPVGAEGELVLDLAVRGGLGVRVDSDGRGAGFVGADGACALRYSGLTVFDADGALVPASLELAGSGLALRVQDQHARYPLTIDPVAQQAYLKASNTGDGDYFGWSVAISGNTLVVGAFGEDSASTGVDGDQLDDSISVSGAAYVFQRTGGSWVQQAYLKASNADSSIIGHYFGHSVAIDGDTVVVSAYREDSGATGVDGDQDNTSMPDSGAAYVFVRSGATWSQQAYLKASNTGGADEFGHSVDISGDTIVVGATQEDSQATGIDGDGSDNSMNSAGAAYVFVRSGATWSQQAYLKASNTGNDRFGHAVAIHDDTIVVGATNEASSATGVNGDQGDDSLSTAGAAYVFVRSGATWSQQAYLKASNTDSGDRFGDRVDISGDTIVVGSLYERSNATGVDGDQSDNSLSFAGAVYVFVRDGIDWSQQAYLKASNTDAEDQFGHSISISGSVLVVGARNESGGTLNPNGAPGDNSLLDSGAAYVFVRNGTTWSQGAYLKASNAGADDKFGHAVAVDGNTAVVGAYTETSAATGIDGDGSDNSSLNAGAAYVYVASPEASISISCDPASNHYAGDYVKLNTSTPMFGDGAGVHLEATDGPPLSFGFFLVSAGASSSIPVFNGVLCLDSPAARYNGQVADNQGNPALNSIGAFNAAGVLQNLVGTSAVGTGFDVPYELPYTPPGQVIVPGDTWYFQLWYRDQVPPLPNPGSSANFSNVAEVTFL